MSSKAKLIAYFDVISPYSFINMSVLPRYEKILPATIDYVPINLGATIIKSGNKPPAFVKAKGDYMRIDAEHANRYWNLDMKYPSDFELTIVKRGSLLAQRFLTAVKEHQPSYLVKGAQAFASRVWVTDEPIHTEENILEVAEKLQIPEYQELMKESKTDSIKKLFQQRTGEAMDSGAFGLPWFVLKREGKPDEVYFGSDRLHYICQELGVEYKRVV